MCLCFFSFPLFWKLHVNAIFILKLLSTSFKSFHSKDSVYFCELTQSYIPTRLLIASTAEAYYVYYLSLKLAEGAFWVCDPSLSNWPFENGVWFSCWIIELIVTSLYRNNYMSQFTSKCYILHFTEFCFWSHWWHGDSIVSRWTFKSKKFRWRCQEAYYWCL